MARPKLLGPDGEPLDLERLKVEEATATVTGVRPIVSDDVSAGLTPVRLAQILRDAEDGSDPTAYLELAERMEEKDLHYLGVLSTRKRQVAQLPITVEAASDSAEDVKIADFARELFAGDEFEDVVFDILDAVGKGFSVTEIVWDMSERQWMPKKLVLRDPRWFAFDRNDGTTPMLRVEQTPAEALLAGKLPNIGLAPLPAFKYIVARIKAKSGLPIRGGLARSVAWAYLFKNYDLKDWLQFAEVYGMPIRIGKYHPGATDIEKRTLLRALASIAADAAAIIPQSMAIEFIEGQGNRDGALFEKLATYLDLQVSKAVLGQTTTTDAVNGGHAVSQEHNQVRGDIERADAKVLAATLKRDLMIPAIDLNFGPQKQYPKVQIGRPEKENVVEMAAVLEKLVPLGLRIEASQVRDKIGFEEPAKGAEILTPPAAPPPPFGSGSPTDDEEPATASARRRRAALQAQGDGGDAIAALADDALDGWQKIVEPMTQPIEELLADVSSLEEFRDRLAELVKTMAPDQVADLLARAGFSARLAGELGAPIDDAE
jgi:phage gp29-like protein